MKNSTYRLSLFQYVKFYYAIQHFCGKTYKGSVDARRILESARYQDIAELCPQAFRPFVEFLENL
jgi:hypothetical protein